MRLPRRFFVLLIAVAACAASAVALAAEPGTTDYTPAAGGTYTGVRSTALGLPQTGASGTVGAGELTTELRRYHDSGQYSRDLQAVGGAATSYLTQRLSDNTAPSKRATSCKLVYKRVGAAKKKATAKKKKRKKASSKKRKRTTARGSAKKNDKDSAKKRAPKKKKKAARKKKKAAKKKAPVYYTQSRVCSSSTDTPQRLSGKPAIVLDIDETSLSNYASLSASNFSAAGLVPTAAAGNADTIAPTRDLYRLARRNGVAVFFVTGRPSLSETPTASNLRAAGYDQGWDGLQFKPSGPSTLEYKSGARAAIEARGYDIVANVGDQESDLDGGHADRAFKLPNPYYFISD